MASAAQLQLDDDGTPVAKGTDKRFSNLGRSFEGSLRKQHDVYRTRRAADVEKIEVPVIQIGAQRRDDKGRMVFTGMRGRKASTDYMGLLREGRQPGRCVRMEAKSSRQNRVDVGSDHGVQPHQAAALNRAAAAGAFAAVLVCIPAGMWIVPWVNWGPPRDAPHRKSLNPAALDAAGERFGSAAEAQRIINGRGAPADWLAAAMRRGWV